MIKYIWYILIIFISFSCKTIKKTVSLEKSDTISELIEKRMNLKKSEYYCCEKVDIKISGEESINARAKVMISTGKFIFISASFMGLEIGRAQITPDSIKYINRLKREYFFGNKSNMEKMIGFEINYEILENLLITGMPIDNNENKNKILKKFLDNGREYIYQYADNQKRFIKIYYEKYPLKESRIELSDRIKEFCFIGLFTEYQDKPYYPRYIKATLINKGRNRDFEITIGKIENKSFPNTSFKINKNYNEL